MNTLLAILADTHFGGFSAVAPPEIQTDAGQVVKGNAAQAWLYHLWLDDFKIVKERAKGKRLTVVHCGDVIEGEHHNALAHLPDVKDQESLAVVMLTPWRNLADKFYMVKGTEAHASLQHMSERRIAHELAATALDFHLRLEVDGLLCDFAHHSDGTLAKIRQDVIDDCLLDSQPIPRFIFRAHKHLLDDSGGKWPNERVIRLPSWQLRTSFGWKIAANKRAAIGLVILDQGKIEVIRHTPRPDPIRKA